MVQKTEKKNENLLMDHEHFGLYEKTLKEKYDPVFKQMKKVIHDKRVEYTLFLNKQLSKNEDRIQIEKSAVEKLQSSFKGLSDTFKAELESELDIIQKEELIAKK